MGSANNIARRRREQLPHAWGLVVLALAIASALFGVGCVEEQVRPVPSGVEVHDPEGSWHFILPEGYLLDPRARPLTVMENTVATIPSATRFALLRPGREQPQGEPADVVVSVFLSPGPDPREWFRLFDLPYIQQLQDAGVAAPTLRNERLGGLQTYVLINPYGEVSSSEIIALTHGYAIRVTVPGGDVTLFADLITQMVHSFEQDR